jgi:hypothetical protein
MSKFSDYEYRKLPGFDMNAFEGANQAIPMKTLVIYCLDLGRSKSHMPSPSILGTRSTRAKSSPTKMALALDPREHCSPRPTRVDAPPSL